MSANKDYRSLGKTFQKENPSLLTKLGNGLGQGVNPKSASKKPKNSKNFIKSTNKNNSQETSTTLFSQIIKFIQTIFGVFISILGFLFLPFYWVFEKQIKWLLNWTQIRENMIKFAFGCMFVVMMLNLVSLQVIGSKSSKAFAGEPIEAKRGKIMYRDISQGIKNIELATNTIRSEISIDPVQLRQQIKSGHKLEDMLQIISSRTNLNYKKLLDDVNKGLAGDEKSRYAKIKDQVTEEEASGISNLLSDSVLRNEYGFDSWLRMDDNTFRTYTEGRTLAQTLGFTKKYKSDKEETKNRAGCEDIITNNEARGTLLTNGYYLGSGGLEQKYCGVLAGLNGRKLGNQELTDANKTKNNQVQNGADIYLNIDKNIQKKAEMILEEAVRFNTNENGSPKDGCVMVTEASSGKILAMASYPFFDPNFYAQYYNSNQKAFLNSCTGNDYEVGSVMKPITVAAAIDQNQKPKDGKKYGVDSNFKYIDSDKDGKGYKDGYNGKKLFVTNANNVTWKDFGPIGLKEIIRDSINTGISEITDKMGGENLFYYLKDKFRFGQTTNVDLLEDTNGDISSFETDINCTYCWAAKGFGQGFTASVLQLMRAYSGVANGGKLVEPKLISEIKCYDGTIESISTQGSCVPSKLKLNRLPDEEIISKNAADNVTNYMIAAAEEGFMGNGPTKGMVPGYRVAVKSGTAQVSRRMPNPDGGEPLTCNAQCNTLRGIYDHTYIGFNTGESRYIVAVKLAEPKPGSVNNFSSTTLPTFFSEMMRYTLEYNNVPKDR